MIVLGIESSCDDTCAAVVADGRRILSDIVSSQDEIHSKYGGVVPEIASRSHDRCIVPVLREALGQAGMDLRGIDGIAVTNRPGLIGSLLVGVSVAKGLAYGAGIPLIGVSHLQAHLYAPFLELPDREPPRDFERHVGLVASGGHTALYLVEKPTEILELAPTLDDAVGEAYDKVAKLLGLSYPGGPALEAVGRKFRGERIAFPRPSSRRHPLGFSMSGLKTAVRNYVHEQRAAGGKPGVSRIAASFQDAVADVLCSKTLSAARAHQVRLITFSGGVAANRFIRERLAADCQARGIDLLLPPMCLCTDNAAMIAGLGYHFLRVGVKSGWEMSVVASSRQAEGSP